MRQNENVSMGIIRDPRQRVAALLVMFAVLAVFVVVVASPAEAVYKEGNISCQSGYDEYTWSTSSEYTWHEHYMESNGTLEQYTKVAFKIRSEEHTSELQSH